jgi:hypothetical protein
MFFYNYELFKVSGGDETEFLVPRGNFGAASALKILISLCYPTFAFTLHGINYCQERLCKPKHDRPFDSVLIHNHTRTWPAVLTAALWLEFKQV